MDEDGSEESEAQESEADDAEEEVTIESEAFWGGDDLDVTWDELVSSGWVPPEDGSDESSDAGDYPVA